MLSYTTRRAQTFSICPCFTLYILTLRHGLGGIKGWEVEPIDSCFSFNASSQNNTFHSFLSLHMHRHRFLYIIRIQKNKNNYMDCKHQPTMNVYCMTSLFLSNYMSFICRIISRQEWQQGRMIEAKADRGTAGIVSRKQDPPLQWIWKWTLFVWINIFFLRQSRYQ